MIADLGWRAAEVASRWRGLFIVNVTCFCFTFVAKIFRKWKVHNAANCKRLRPKVRLLIKYTKNKATPDLVEVSFKNQNRLK